MKCEACRKNDATVHMTNIVGGRIEKLRLCGACAAEKGFVVEPEVSPSVSATPAAVTEFIGSVLEAIQTGVQSVDRRAAETKTPCPACGITLADFQKRGRLGCPNDYVVFEDELSRLLRKLHRADVHVGSVPSRAQARRGRKRFIRERIDALKKELDGVVRTERFEEAARLRDRLRELEKAEEDGA